MFTLIAPVFPKKAQIPQKNKEKLHIILSISLKNITFHQKIEEKVNIKNVYFIKKTKKMFMLYFLRKMNNVHVTSRIKMITIRLTRIKITHDRSNKIILLYSQ